LKTPSGKSSTTKSKKEKGLLAEMKLNSSQLIKDPPKKIVEEIPYSFGNKEMLRTTSMGDKFKKEGGKETMKIRPETNKKYPLKLKLKSNKIIEESDTKLTMFLEKEKPRNRRKIPEVIDEELDIEKPEEIKIENKVEKSYKMLNKINISNENVYGKKLVLPGERNIASIDQRKVQTPRIKEIMKINPKDQGELSFKNHQKESQFKKPDKFEFDNTPKEPTFANLSMNKKEVIPEEKTLQTLDKSDFGKLDRENKKILNKMRKPIPEKSERESGGYTHQNSESGSHAKEADEDHEDFNFDDFGF
jgi:hypothetical protein